MMNLAMARVVVGAVESTARRGGEPRRGAVVRGFGLWAVALLWRRGRTGAAGHAVAPV